MENELRSGIYRHFKGGLYRVTGSAEHTETGEMLAMYYEVNEDGTQKRDAKKYARPLAMFNEKVTANGNEVPRFEFKGANCLY